MRSVYRQFLFSLLGSLAIILIGTIGFIFLEQLSFFNALWLTVVSVLTVGYGDVVPSTTNGKIFTLILIPLGIGVATYGLGTLTALIIEGNFIRRFQMEKKINHLHHHTIVCGIGRVGTKVIDYFRQHHIPFVIIDKDEESLKKLFADVPYIVGDATEDSILLQAGIKRAHGLIATLPNDADNVFITLTARGYNPSITIVARSEKVSSKEKLQRAGANRIINPESIGGERMAMAIMKPSSIDYLDSFLLGRQSQYSIEEFIVHADSPFLNKSIRESNIRATYGYTIIAINRKDSLLPNPSPDEILQQDDVIVALGSTVKP